MLSDKPWKPEAVVRLASVILASLAAGLLLGSALNYLLPSPPRALQRNLLAFLVGTLSFQGMGLVLVSLFLRGHAIGWGEAFGFSEPNWGRCLLLGGTVALLVLPLTFLLGNLAAYLVTALGLHVEPQASVKILREKLPPTQVVIYAVGAIGLAPLAEEVLFRGILYPTLKQHASPFLGLWVTSALFALSHLNLVAFLPLLFLALVLTWLYERTQNLLASITTHGVFNAVNFYLLVAPPSWAEKFMAR